MKYPEEAIERVLTRLRDAETPAGLETRILDALAERAARDSRRFWRGWLAAPKYWRFTAHGMTVAGACGGVLVVALLVASTHKAGRVAANGLRLVASSRDPGGAEEFVPQRRKPQGDARAYGTAEAVPLGTTEVHSFKTDLPVSKAEVLLGRPESAIGRADVPADKRQTSGIESPVDYEQLAMSEMLAPSRPAPPLPLTKQEKLLAEVAHKGDPEQVADLNPDVRARQVEIAKAEFHDFFEPVLVKPPPARENE